MYSIYLSPDELLKSDSLVEEPINKIVKKIEKNKDNKWILASGRGTGKTTVLKYMEQKRLNTANPLIYMYFDPVTVFSKEPNDRYSDALFKHNIELLMSIRLLGFMRKYYPTIYEKEFKNVELRVQTLENELVDSIRNSFYKKMNLSYYLSPLEITQEIVEQMKKHLSLSSLDLAIDRFDWVNERSTYSQGLLKNYFTLFNQVVITSDDETLKEEKRRVELLNKGYQTISSLYGTDKEAVHAILTKRISKYNLNREVHELYFDTSLLTDSIDDVLIQRTDGNLSMMLSSLQEVFNLWHWYQGKGNVEEMFDKAITEKVEVEKQLKKTYSSPFKLNV